MLDRMLEERSEVLFTQWVTPAREGWGKTPDPSFATLIDV
jgi:hypothetical protein